MDAGACEGSGKAEGLPGIRSSAGKWDNRVTEIQAPICLDSHAEGAPNGPLQSRQRCPGLPSHHAVQTNSYRIACHITKESESSSTWPICHLQDRHANVCICHVHKSGWFKSVSTAHGWWCSQLSNGGQAFDQWIPTCFVMGMQAQLHLDLQTE